MTTIIAHAGCEGTPPNSLSYIRTAIAAGVDAVEFDLRLGGERVLLSHDPLEREKLADYLTLEDAAALARDAGVGLNCDLKEPEVFAPALQTLRRMGMERCTVFTGSYPSLGAFVDGVHGYYINTDHTGLVAAAGSVTPEQARALGELFYARRDPALLGLNIDYLTLTEESMAVFRAMHVPLCCWTVDDEEQIEYLLEQRVACITTNLAAAAVRRRGSGRYF